MDAEEIIRIKKNIVAIGRLLWEKNLVSGLNGNISARVDDERILITASGTCLGILQVKDVLLTSVSAEAVEPGRPSSEIGLHLAVYDDFPSVSAIIHTHTLYTNAYFLDHKEMTPSIFETRLTLGRVESVKQTTPCVHQFEPVLKALHRNNIVSLGNHGVVAIGQQHFDCFLLIQGLEEALQIEAYRNLFRGTGNCAVTSETSKQPRDEDPVQHQLRLFGERHVTVMKALLDKSDEIRAFLSGVQGEFRFRCQFSDTGGVTWTIRKQGVFPGQCDEKADAVFMAEENVWVNFFQARTEIFPALFQKKIQCEANFAELTRYYSLLDCIFKVWHRSQGKKTISPE